MMAGIPSLRGFWSRLKEGWDEPVSYEAVRTYHYDRDPPASYLARVVEVFPELSTIEYLITGKGPRNQAEQRAREIQGEVWNMILGSGAGWLAATPGTQARLLEVFERFHAQSERRAELAGSPPPTPQQSVKELGDLLNGPLLRWRDMGTPGVWSDIHPERMFAYVDAMLLALSLGTPGGPDFVLRQVGEDGTGGVSD